MNFAHAEKIAAAVLYEGYMLYPYRATSTKNVQRWNFGTLYPQDYALAQHPVESFRLSAECLVESTPDTTFDIRIRFLHLVPQQAQEAPHWDAGVERTVEFASRRLTELRSAPLQHSFSFEKGSSETDRHAAAHPISGECTVRVEALADGLHKLCLQLTNITPGGQRADCERGIVMLRSFVSAHVLLGVTAGAFISLLDTPEAFRAPANKCQNIGVFPVLVGIPDERATMLCSPIILYDYPQIAPESLGDFFDGTEMDEMLALRVLTLTDEEKREMRKTDDRALRILQRTESMPAEHLAKVHGAIRGMRVVPSAKPSPEVSSQMDLTPSEWDPFADRPAVESVHAFGVELRVGSRVRLWPQKKADIMDMALEGKVAVIEAIEQDLEDNIQLAVVVDDDPGREFGMLRQPGHRFFFTPDEIEPLCDAAMTSSTSVIEPFSPRTS
jgi:hypothetical protein